MIKNKTLVGEYVLIFVLSGMGIAMAAGLLEIHTDGATVTAGNSFNLRVPMTVTLDGKPLTSGVNFTASVVGKPLGQCNAMLYGPFGGNTLNEPGLYELQAGIGACNSANSSHIWKKGKTTLRIRAMAIVNGVTRRGETLTGIDAQ